MLDCIMNHDCGNTYIHDFLKTYMISALLGISYFWDFWNYQNSRSMYTCMSAYMHICSMQINIYVCRQTCIYNTYVSMHVYISAYMPTDMSVLYIHPCVCKHNNQC